MVNTSRGVRALASSMTVIIGVVLVSVGLVVLDVRQGLLTPDGLSQRAGTALADPRLSAFLADRATDAVLAAQPDLTAFRPLIVAVASATVSSHAFQRAAQASLHSAAVTLASGGTAKVVLSIPDLGVLMRSSLAGANPAIVERIPARVRGVLADVGQGPVSRAVIRLVGVSTRLARWALFLLVSGIALMIGGIAAAHDRHRAMADASLHLLVAGVVLIVLRAAGGLVPGFVGTDPLASEAVAALWSALTIGIRAWGLVLLTVGVILLASVQATLDRIAVDRLILGAWQWLTRPHSHVWPALARSVTLVGVGAVAVVFPRAAFDAVAIGCGAVCAFLGVREGLTILRDRVAPAVDGAVAHSWGQGLRRVVIVGAATAVLAVAGTLLLRPGASPVAHAKGLCNGSATLCDWTLDRVTFAGAHNAMSAADVPGWMFPQQERSMPGQFADGVRAFLIDVHYGRPAGTTIVTDLDAETTSRDKIEDAIGREGVDAALNIRARFAGADLGPRGLYLCHGFCETGAQPLGPWMSQLADLVVQNPDEVVMLVIEDYVRPADLAQAFEQAGLDGLVYRGRPPRPWPTLRSLIDTNQRIVVMTESGQPGIDWLVPAFAVTQETPYKFRTPEAMSCGPNRGGTDGSLFLINNWIDTTPHPKPSNAAIVNVYDPLLARARRCAAERGLTPNILAVDFYRTGDLVRVVRTLNE